ncbi:hypothetical protein SEA_TAYLORSIPHT_56 [Arthrobacter phage TaylorSipht]|nr:hypothetical protein SEA_TAYLORSIPHT_56 [Arthrobacter phage TaylorSipht]
MKIWMEKAERALATGQPRLAELYMRRALSETPEGRAWLARQDFMATLEAVGALVNEWMVGCVDALAAAFPDAGLQADFALAGPARG